MMIELDRRDVQLVVRELYARRVGAKIQLSPRQEEALRRLSIRAWASADEDEASSPLAGGF